MDKKISQYLKSCYKNYVNELSDEISNFPKTYIFPDGNPITPVLPIQLIQNDIMLIGAFPSARFERRKGKLIPVANNLSPFATEEYFDGREIRKQASRDFLDKYYFPQLNINPNKIWITDLVKIYLFPEKHIKNCKEISKNKFVNTHNLFFDIAKSKTNLKYMNEEIKLCNPKLIITLGEVPARVIRNEFKLKNNDLLNGSINSIKVGNDNYKISSLAHPEIRRRNKEWDKFTVSSVNKLNSELNK